MVADVPDGWEPDEEHLVPDEPWKTPENTPSYQGDRDLGTGFGWREDEVNLIKALAVVLHNYRYHWEDLRPTDQARLHRQFDEISDLFKRCFSELPSGWVWAAIADARKAADYFSCTGG